MANQKTRQATPEGTQGAHSQTSYPRVQQENTLDKKRQQNPRDEEERDREEKRNENKGHGEHKVIEQEQEAYLDIPMLQEAS